MKEKKLESPVQVPGCLFIFFDPYAWLPNRLTVTLFSRFEGLPKHGYVAGSHKFISHFESITKVRLLPVLTETFT